MALATGKMSPRLTARLAGLLYLAEMILVGFAIYVRMKLVVPGDAAATAANILASEDLYRLAFSADALGAPVYIGVTLLLYRLLKPAGPGLSMLAAAFSLVAIAIGAANLINHLAPLIVLGGAPYLAAFSPEQSQALAMTFLRMHALGYHLSVVLFGLYLFLLGVLIIRSIYLPRLLGFLLIVESVCALTYSFANFLEPALAARLFPAILAPGLLGEGGLTLWLLLIGVSSARWREQAKA